MYYAHIVGWGKYVPNRIVTNDDLAKIMDTSDEWIRTRTGIRERRFAEEHETTATMSIAAARLALDRARIDPKDIDLIIVATLTPDYVIPATACLVQDALGASKAGAYDLSAACAGFIYGLTMGANMIKTGSAKVVLVIGAETLSRVLDVEDRSTYPLFGDGAGAVVLQASENPGGILTSVLGADGSGGEHLILPGGGCKLPASHQTVDQRLHYLKMNGREVYRFATRVMGKAAQEVCEKAGVDVNTVDLLVPHQANIRIIESARKQLKLAPDKVFTNLDKYGNTSAASIPIALCEAIEQGRVHTHDKIVMVGFGAGLTWGATVVEWGIPMPHKRRQWWYRGLRWLVYRRARVRSMVLRLTRWLQSLLPEEDEFLEAPPKKPAPRRENGHQNGRNGTHPEPAETSSPARSAEEKMLETSGRSDGR